MATPNTAPTYVNTGSLIDATVLAKFMEGSLDNVTKEFVFLDKIQSKGNFKSDFSGKHLEKNIEVGVPTADYRGDLASRNFSSTNPYVTMQVAPSNIEVTGQISSYDADVAKAAGSKALIRVTEEIFKQMARGLKNKLNEGLIKGNASGSASLGIAASANSPVPLFGMPTVFGVGATAYKLVTSTGISSGTAAAATDIEVCPNITYCGVSTNPGTTPSGITGFVAGSLSPKLINWSSTALNSTASSTWTTNCLDAIRYGISRAQVTRDSMDIPDFGFMDRTKFLELEAKLDNVQRLVLTGQSQSPNMGAYQGNMIPFKSVSFYWSEFMPAGAIYILNSNHMEFNYMDLTVHNGDDALSADMGKFRVPAFKAETAFDINKGAHLAVARMAGQLWVNPSRQVCLYNWA